MRRIRDNAGRLVLLGLLALGILAAWHWRGVFDPVGLTELVNGGSAAPLVFLGVHILASLLFGVLPASEFAQADLTDRWIIQSGGHPASQRQ